MKILSTILLCVAASPLVFAGDITAIFGTGNPDTGWTIGTGDGITLGLRAKNRTTGDTTNVAGTYTFATAPGPRGLWNYEFSINSGTVALDQFNYVLSADHDASLGILMNTVDPLSWWGDNSYGTAATLNGGGVEGPASTYAGSNTVAQNSENITFGDYPGGALALTPDATYAYQLSAYDKSGVMVATVNMNVVVGNGGAPVPDAGSTSLLLALGLGGVVFLRRRQRRAVA